MVEKLRTRKKLRALCTLIILFGIMLLGIFIAENLTELRARHVPQYSMADLGEYVEKEELNEDDYSTVFLQTGLGKEGFDQLRAFTLSSRQMEGKLQELQKGIFEPGELNCRKIGIITHEERMEEPWTTNTKIIYGMLRDGDVLLSYSTHSLGWRHGHAGIVVDAENGKVLEAAIWGENSELRNARHWLTYPTFIHLRLKEEYQTPGYETLLTEYSMENLHDIPYGLVSSLWMKMQNEVENTQCAYEVWQAYQQLGLDIDSDGTFLVTPQDIAGSEYFQVVQAYGVDLQFFME